jgi:hypothetical protein
MSETDNLYILLDLNPAVDDLAAIGERILQKQREWSTLTGTNARLADAKRQSVGKDKNRFLDPTNPTFRREQAAEARQILAERDEANRNRLREIIELLKANGFYSEADVSATARRLKGTISAAAIASEFERAGLKKKSGNQKKTRPSRPRLEPSIYSGIAKALLLLDLTDLYEFLECNPKDSISTLRQRVVELDAVLKRKAATDAKAKVRQELLGRCNDVFRDIREKEKYDNSLAFQSMDRMAELIEQAGADGMINFAEYKFLLAKAESYGVQADIAREYIEDHASGRGWRVIDETAVGQQTETPFATQSHQASTAPQRAAFSFLGHAYSTKEQLAEAFSEHWIDAIGLWKTRNTEILNWLKHDLGQVDLANRLEGLRSKSGLSDEAVLLCMTQMLSPKLIPTFRSLKLTRETLVALANDAIGNQAAGDTLRDLYSTGLHKLDAMLPGLKWLGSIGEAWSRAIEEYEILRRRIQRYAKVVDLDDPKVVPCLLVVLLAATTPGSTSVTALRLLGGKASSKEARECQWFSDLGEPGTTSPAALLIISQVATDAEAETSARRIEKARIARERQYKLFVNFFGYGSGVFAGLAAGAIVGIYTVQTFGLVAAVVLGFIGARNGRKWVESASGNPGIVRAKGLAIGGFASAVLFFGAFNFYQPHASSVIQAPPPSANVAPIQNFRVLNAVMADSLDANGRPKGVSRAFKGPNASIVLYFDYQNARPNYDLIGIMVTRGSESFYPCERTTLLFSNGSMNCKWVSNGTGNQKVTVSRNGSLVQELSFSVTDDPVPPERRPLDIRPEAQAPIAVAPPEEPGVQGQKPAARFGYLSVNIDNEPAQNDRDKVRSATVLYQNRPVITLRGDMPGVNGGVAAKIVRLDASASFPQVIFTSYSGGAHCCTETKIATIDRSGSWHAINGKTLDGDFGYELTDLDGDGSFALVSLDNRFLNAFACYACSYAPTRIEKLVGSELKDVTRDPKYRKFLRERLNKMEARAQTLSQANGYWGGWVAAKSLVGELDDAWRKMLVSYDRQSQWVIEECQINAPPGKCPDNQKRQLDFPEGLVVHLVRNGYITANQKARLATTTPTSVESAPKAEASTPKSCFNFNGKTVCN